MTTNDDTDGLDENDPDYLSEEEFDRYNDLENSAKLEKLNSVIEEYRLRDYLDDDEMQVLFDFWQATHDTEFMIDAGSFTSVKLDHPVGKIHEGATRKAEEHFLAARERMLESPGWMLLDPTVQREIFDELFRIRYGEK